VAANNGFRGFLEYSLPDGATTSLMLVRSAVANNATSFSALNTRASLGLGHSTVTRNATALFTGAGGSILSYSDNNIDGNSVGTETSIGHVTKR
jgi:hypothetical protein